MKLRNYTIRTLLKITASVVIIALIVFTLIFLSQQKNSLLHREALVRLEQLYHQNLKLKHAKDIFLFVDIHSEELYKLDHCQSTQLHDSLIRAIKKNLQILSNQNKYAHINEINTLINDYNKKFYFVKDLVQKRGFMDFGLEGKLREKIHIVEGIIEQQKDYRLKSHMLMLRRHEKDYIIRKDLKYLDKFNNELQQTKAYLSQTNKSQQKTIELLNEYGDLFKSFVSVDREIGQEGAGAQGELNNLSDELAIKIDEVRKYLTRQNEAFAARIYLNMLVLIAIISILTVFVFTKVAKHITNGLKSIHILLNRMGKGEIPKPIKIFGKDEISEIEMSINELTTALRNTRDFAIEVGNGNFYSEVNVFGNTGELGLNLLEMRKKLMEIAKERENVLLENEQRNWLNESLAKTSDILRNKYENTAELCFHFIRFIIQRTSALQGGVFLVQENDLNKYIELKASFALDRRKYINKTLDIHEGLPGACIYEKDVIFITDIPKDYTHITTGLGNSNPSCILLAPIITDMHEVVGCIEVASFKIFEQAEIEFIKKSCINLASILKITEMINFNENIITEMKQKNHELQTREEELRQNMEELTAIREDMERREKELNEEIAELRKSIMENNSQSVNPSIVNPITN